MNDDFIQAIAKGLVDRTLDKCSRWSEHRIIMPPPNPGPIQWAQYPWQPEILNCMTGMVSVRKAAQMGFSIIGLCKCLFCVAELRRDVLLILPTAGIAGDFSKGRLDPIVKQSPHLVNLFSRADSVQHKVTGDYTNLYLRGSIAESGLVSVPVGFVIVDEFDRCDKDTLALVQERMAAYKEGHKHIFCLSTPTLPKKGISELYDQGTQEIFVFNCPSCSKLTHLIWPDCFEVRGDSPSDPDRHLSYVKCKECNNPLPHEGKSDWLKKAYWHAQEKVDGHRSFYINQMYAPELTAGSIAEKWLKAQVDEGSAVQFWNQTLGLPYLIPGAQVTEEMLQSCFKDYSIRDKAPEYAGRRIYMGVDVGTFMDVVITEFIPTAELGTEPHLNSIARVLWAGRFAGSDWGVLDHLMEQWQVQHCCIDFQPETTKAEEFARRHHGFVTLVMYRQGTTGSDIRVAENQDRVPYATVNRTAFFDLTLGRFHKKRIELPKDIPHVFKEHVQSLCRTYTLDVLGNPKADYVTVGSSSADHQAHALVYSEIAHMRGHARRTGRPIKVGETYSTF